MPDGTLIYYQTHNVDAAKSIRTNHLNTGGSLGYKLDGQNMIAYVWDAGHPRVTHQEYHGFGGNSRVSIEDGDTEGGRNTTKIACCPCYRHNNCIRSGFNCNRNGTPLHRKSVYVDR